MSSSSLSYLTLSLRLLLRYQVKHSKRNSKCTRPDPSGQYLSQWQLPPSFYWRWELHPKVLPSVDELSSFLPYNLHMIFPDVICSDYLLYILFHGRIVGSSIWVLSFVRWELHPQVFLNCAICLKEGIKTFLLKNMIAVSGNSQQTFFACTFCFPNTDHVMILRRFDPLSCSLKQAWICLHALFLMNRTKDQISWVSSHDLYWENKMYKRKRSIETILV